MEIGVFTFADTRHDPETGEPIAIDGYASSYRPSEPRAVALKGVENPVEVVSVDWR